MIRASQLKTRFLDVFACFTLIEMGDHNPFPLIIKKVPPPNNENCPGSENIYY